MTNLPPLPHTLRATLGVTCVVLIVSEQATETRYGLLPDCNLRGDFQFSVLIHAVVKIFRLAVSMLGLTVRFSFKHMSLVPIQWKRWVAGHCSGPMGPAIWLGLLNSIKWSTDSMCHKGCLGRVKSKISVCGWACYLITSPKSCNVQNLAGTCSKGK